MLPPSVASDPLSVVTILAAAGGCGHLLGATRVGGALSGPVCAMAVTFALASSGVLPAASPSVSAAQLAAVQLATPLLLLEADLLAVGRRAGMMIPAFTLGSAGTTLGALVGAAVSRAPLIAAFGPEDGLKVAAALAAKNVGGGINFVAVAAALRLSPAPFAAALAVDNVMALVYFPLCTFLGRKEADPAAASRGGGGDGGDGDDASRLESSAAGAQLAGKQGLALALALLIVAASRAASRAVAPGSELPIATAIAVACATAAPKLLAPLASSASEMGSTCLFLFFASAGWTGGALGPALLAGGPALVRFLGALYAVHLAVVLGAGRALRRAFPSARLRGWLAPPRLLVGSNANIGGTATASTLAVGCGWPSLVAPSLLVGNLGNVVATPLGILLYALMRTFTFA